MLRITPATERSLIRLRDILASNVERSPHAAPMVLAAIVGLGAGLAAVGFSSLVDLSDHIFFSIIADGWLGSLPRIKLILIPALGGLLIVPITVLAIPGARGHSVPEVMAALDSQSGRLPALGAIAKIVASALTIGSGGSVGKQGPVVFLGSSFGSFIGQTLRLNEQTMQLLVAAGAAGGIAGIFNAPIAGVFFALEVLLRRFSTRNFSVVVLSSIVATVIAIQIRGDTLEIPIPSYNLISATEIPLYVILGAGCGVVGAIFIRFFYWTEEGFSRIPALPPWLLPALGGALVGALALLDDNILGIREGARDQALLGTEPINTMLLLLFLKMIATSITVNSGGSGGVLFPALFIGAMTGGIFGEGANILLPNLTESSGAYATAGMAAMFAAVSHAPITSTLILIEMTDDFDLMVPILTAVATATVISQLLSRGTIYSIKAESLGVIIEDDAEPSNIMAQLRVSDAMAPVMNTFELNSTLPEITANFADDPDPLGLVLNKDGAIFGVLTGFDYSTALASGNANLTAAEICSTEIRTINANQTLHQALQIFAARGIRALPVVDSESPRIPQGLLRRTDITRTYAEAVERRSARTRRERLRTVRRSDDVRYLELRVTRESGLSGRMLSQVELTENAVIVAIRHDGATLIPRGHTLLQEGDRVTVISSAASVAEVRTIFEGPQ